jgi:hypothetical protein
MASPRWQAWKAQAAINKKRMLVKSLAVRLREARGIKLRAIAGRFKRVARRFEAAERRTPEYQSAMLWRRYRLPHNAERRRKWAKETRRQRRELFAALRAVGWIDASLEIITDPAAVTPPAPNPKLPPGRFGRKFKKEQRRLAGLERWPAVRGVIFEVDRAGGARKIIVDYAEYRRGEVQFQQNRHRYYREHPWKSPDQQQSVMRKRYYEQARKRRPDVRERQNASRRMRRLKEMEIVGALREMGWIKGYDLVAPAEGLT